MKNKMKLIITIIAIIIVVILIPFKIKIKEDVKEINAIAYKYICYDNYNKDNKILNGYNFQILGLINIDNIEENVKDLNENKKEKENIIKPLNIKWNPYIYSGYLKENKSKSYEKKYYEFVDAIINGKEKVACNNEEEAFDLMMTLNSNFPPFVKVVQEYTYVNGYMIFTYNGSKEERENIINSFGRRIEEIINKNVMESDTKTMAAIALYHFYASKIKYDYDAAKDDNNIYDLSVYRGIMNYSGICQTFAPAYAYLLNVIGIDSIEAGALNVDPNIDPHVWTLMKLNSKEYFADITFESATNGNGLRYFGMNRDRRELDGYLQKDTNLGFNLMNADKLNIEDNKFEELINCEEVLEIKRSEGKMEIIFMTPKGEVKSFYITD